MASLSDAPADDDMTEDNGPNDVTRRIDPEDDDATRAFDPIAEDETRALDRGEVTAEPAATQRLGATPVPGGGPRTERIRVAQQRSIAGWLIALAVIVSFVVGGVFGYSQRDGSDEGVVAKALVATNGGVLNFAGSGKLEVPPNALPTATAIAVRKVTNDNRLRLGPEGDPSSAVYEPGELEMYAFEPADLRFQQPVKITLPRPLEDKALLIDTQDGARVVGIEAEGSTVTLETTSFSFEDL
jgi:hypothetical protein